MIYCNLEINWCQTSHYVVGTYSFGQPLVGHQIQETVQSQVICECDARRVMATYAFKNRQLGVDLITFSTTTLGDIKEGFKTTLFDIKEPA